MARLNEPVVPMESIESLKKRFMRQNREIARVNSNQAIRIRNLENEVSNLLTDNLSLREQVAHYKLELENDSAQRIVHQTVELRAQLEEKLQEIGAIVAGLGHAPREKKRSSETRRISFLHNGQERPPRERRSWGDQDGKLPPILENKSYPRKTLDSLEIADLVNTETSDSIDSPEIGPPPVSTFVNEDPVKIDLPRRPQTSDEEDTPENSIPSVNLEQRRKRKDGSQNSTNVPASRFEPTIEPKPSDLPLKVGAKRKLSVREDEEVKTMKSTEDIEVSNSTSDLNDRSHQDQIEPRRRVSLREQNSNDSQSVSITSHRKVLAPKSVNNSPKKVTLQNKNGDKPSITDLPKPTHPKARLKDQHISIDSSNLITNLPVTDIVVENVTIHEPETPAGLDIISPPPSRPSTIPTASRDTPPPHLNAEAEGQRPSRRARGAVSYAEPNLRDKMRRPTKEMVDAVIRDGNKSNNTVHRREDGVVLTVSKIKAEREADVNWRDFPIAVSSTMDESPLRSKTALTDSLPSSITSHRRRRESLLQQNELDDQDPSTGSAIVAMLAEKRKAKAAERLQQNEEAKDLDSSSRITPEASRGSASGMFIAEKDMKEQKLLVRSKRSSTSSREIPRPEEGDMVEVETTRKFATATSRRRQSSLGLGSTASSDDVNKRDTTIDKAGKRSIAPGLLEAKSNLKRSMGTARTVTPGDLDPSNDRVAGRRRSMML